MMTTVGSHMTRAPLTISLSTSIDEAAHLMRERGFRHLPVLDSGKLVGIVSDRDLKLAKSFRDSDDFSIDDVMSPQPYAVMQETPLEEVVRTMASHKYGCTIIVDEGGAVCGIFTTTDALEQFHKLLHDQPLSNAS